MNKYQTNTESLHSGHRDRMKDRYFESDLSTCSDLLLLEMLLYYAVPRIDTNDIAQRLLDKFRNINGVLTASKDDFLSIQGLGENAWLLLKTVNTLSDALISEREDIVNLSEKNTLNDFIFSSSYSAANDYINVVFMNYRMEVVSDVRYNYSAEEPFVPSKVFDYNFVSGEKFCICALVKPQSEPIPDKDVLKLAYNITSELLQRSIELLDFYFIGNGEARSVISRRVVVPQP